MLRHTPFISVSTLSNASFSELTQRSDRAIADDLAHVRG
jgi:hypothetical protein